MIIFTKHALKRMHERSIAKKQVESTVMQSEFKIAASNNVTIFRKKHGGKTLEVVSESESGRTIIITTYWI